MTKIIDRRNKSMGGGSKRSIHQIKNIAVHYSATSTGDTASFEKFWKGTHGWNTGGYHEVVLTNGDVELNYDPDTVSNGVGGQNTRMYNICYVGSGQPNAKQLKTLKERVNYNRKRFGLPVSAVKGHREYRGQSTQCPALNMDNFRKSLGATTGQAKPTGTGGSIVDYLKANGINSSFANRKKLATKHGIKNYKGTAAQNTQLLNKLKAGKPKPAKPAKKGDQSTNSIVDYLKSIGENSSLSNRKKLAKKYGVSNYSGTSAQNTKLLKAMRGGAKAKTTTALKVGNTVTLKKSASHFATGQSILNSAKGKKYKILQVKSDRVLLDKIMSWVKKSDVQ